MPVSYIECGRTEPQGRAPRGTTLHAASVAVQLAIAAVRPASDSTQSRQPAPCPEPSLWPSPVDCTAHTQDSQLLPVPSLHTFHTCSTEHALGAGLILSYKTEVSSMKTYTSARGVRPVDSINPYDIQSYTQHVHEILSAVGFGHLGAAAEQEHVCDAVLAQGVLTGHGLLRAD